MILGGHEFMVECEELAVEVESLAPLLPHDPFASPTASPAPSPLPAFAPTAAAAAAAAERPHASSGGLAGRAAVLAEMSHLEDMLLARIDYLTGVRRVQASSG
jgi:hypothetical protein